MSSGFRGNLKIVSNGTAQTTEVFVGETRLIGIKKIEIEPILPDSVLEVTLTCYVAALDVEGELKNPPEGDKV